MRLSLILFIVFSTCFNSSAQTICTKIVPYFEKLAQSQTHILVKEAVYRYDIIPEVLPLFEYTTQTIVVSDAYDKVMRKPDGTYCVITVEAVTRTVPSVKVIREGQPPQYVKVLISPALYENITTVRKIKDGKLIVTNAICD